jgi:predicted exporter
VANAHRGKRDIDRAKRERAQQKRDKRLKPQDDAGAPADPDAVVVSMSEQEVLDALESLQARFAADEVDFDEYEATKTELLQQLGG